PTEGGSGAAGELSVLQWAPPLRGRTSVDAYRAVVDKRDQRYFLPRALPEPSLQRILHAARMTGSSKDSEPNPADRHARAFRPPACSRSLGLLRMRRLRLGSGRRLG